MEIEVKDLSFSYRNKLPVLDHIGFSVEKGKFVSLLGPNGVGKSTLFKCMLGLQSRYQGSIFISGADIRSLSARQRARKVAYIPQTTADVFNYSVRDIVLMGTTASLNVFSTPGEKEEQLVDQALEQIGISYLKDRMFMNISGGERQLVQIARALSQQAEILFMDEPTSSLDYGNQVRMLEEIKKLTASGYTIVQSTHNPDQAFLYTDLVLAIHRGKVAAYGSPREVLSEELIRTLYGVDVMVEKLHEDVIRVCIPKYILEQQCKFCK